MTFREAALQTDALKYVAYDWRWPVCLKQDVPVGYPLFLKAVGVVSPSLRFLPFFQGSFILFSAVFFGYCLYRYGFQIGCAVFGALPLPFSKVFRWSWNKAASESVGCALIVIVAGLVLLTHRESKRWMWWALGISVFLSYQCRPAFLFVPGLVFVFGKWPRAQMVSLGPLLLFCCFRWLSVGHFGVVSEGGAQASGYIIQLLQQGDEKRLPEPLRGYATAYFNDVPHAYGVPFMRASDRQYYGLWMNRDHYLNLLNQLTGAKKAGSNLAANAILTRLSLSILKIRWREYLRVAWMSVQCGLQKWPDSAGMATGLAVFVLAYFIRLSHNPTLPLYLSHEFGTLLCLCVIYLVGGLLFLSLVSIPDDRYIWPLYLFVQSTLWVGVYDLIAPAHYVSRPIQDLR